MIVMPRRYEERLRSYADSIMNGSGGVRHSGKGLVYISQWGSLRHATGAAGIVSLLGRGLKVRGQNAGDAMMAFAERQVRLSLPGFAHARVAVCVSADALQVQPGYTCLVVQPDPSRAGVTRDLVDAADVLLRAHLACLLYTSDAADE